MSSSSRPIKLSLRELVILSILAGITFACKLILSPLPNIEPVTLFLTLTALVFGRKAFYTCYVYVLLEGAVYGFGLWWFSYLYIWALLIAVILLLRRSGNYVIWVIVSGLFGLCFGALCAIPYLFTGGWPMAFSYWVAGIPYDLLHAAGNTVIAALLLKPLHRLLLRLDAPRPA